MYFEEKDKTTVWLYQELSKNIQIFKYKLYGFHVFLNKTIHNLNKFLN